MPATRSRSAARRAPAVLAFALCHSSLPYAQEPIVPVIATAAASTVVAGGPATDPEIAELAGVTVRGSAFSSNGQTLYLDEKRAAPVVTEALSGEQIARTGDSDAATTLKRVPGLSLVDGKYVYVRGLGERYSSVLLNGAQIPSPDFTRRVVPLDLFPTELLDGILVQKAYSPDMPGEFGGGTVMLRTREIPRSFFFRGYGTLGYNDAVTGKQGLSYDGGSRDWLGYDDGSRDMPDSLAAATANGNYLRPRSASHADGASAEQLQAYGRDLAASGYAINNKKIGPDAAFGIGLGNGYQLSEDVRVGFIGSLRYNQGWDNHDEQRRTYAATSAGLLPIGAMHIEDTERAVDASGFLGVGVEIGNHHRVSLTNVLLRQSRDRARISDGSVDSVDSRFSEQKWVENELRAHQVSAHHMLPALHNLEVDWQYTHANAGREEPNTRRYRYDHLPDDLLEFSLRAGSNSHTFGKLDDQQDDFSVKATLPFDFEDGSALLLSAGGAHMSRDRDSQIRTFTYQLAPGSPLMADPDFLLNPLDVILAPGNIRADGFALREITRPTDNYFASQTTKAGFLNADFTLRGKYRLALGARREDNQQQVVTYALGSPERAPVVASDDSRNWLPAAAFTWLYSDNAQLRASFSRTLSRPDFRELSNAPFTDPELDIETLGNPDLLTTRIRNLDLRWEYYFSDADSISVALFDKKFNDPIEKLRLPGSSPLLGLANAMTAHNYGIEFDIYKNLGFISERWARVGWLEDFHVGFNYARIRSSIELDPASASYQTNLSRPMQGQSPYVANLQLGYTQPDQAREFTLMFNRSGRRISEVGVDTQPDVYEESWDSLDFLYRQALSTDWRWSLKLRNLLDARHAYTQGGLDTRTFRNGREVSVSLEWRPGSR